MDLFEMTSEMYPFKWVTPFFDGELNATAEIETPNGKATVLFDERGEGVVELMIVGDKLSRDLQGTVRKIVKEYKQQHPEAQLTFQPDERTRNVSGFIQDFIR